MFEYFALCIDFVECGKWEATPCSTCFASNAVNVTNRKYTYILNLSALRVLFWLWIYSRARIRSRWHRTIIAAAEKPYFVNNPNTHRRMRKFSPMSPDEVCSARLSLCHSVNLANMYTAIGIARSYACIWTTTHYLRVYTEICKIKH